MSLTQITAPTGNSISLSDAKDHIRLEIDDDDALIQSMIESVEHLAETFTRRQLITATYDYKIDRFASVIKIPKPPLQSVTSIKYIDTDGNEQTVDSSVYDVDTDSQPGRVILDPDQVWPDTRKQLQAVTIRFVCGYADSGSSPAEINDNVPEVIKRWMLIQIANLYENREEYIVGTIAAKMPFADRLIESLSIPEFF